MRQILVILLCLALSCAALAEGDSLWGKQVRAELVEPPAEAFDPALEQPRVAGISADGEKLLIVGLGGTGKAKTSLPAGTYIIKDGTGKNWYGEEEAFGSEGYYEIMTFGNGQQEVQLKKNYSPTITVNVQENNPDAEGVGSDWESWSDF
jgi:hypothetical protein